MSGPPALSARIDVGPGRAIAVTVDVESGLAALELIDGDQYVQLGGLLPQQVLDLATELNGLARQAGKARAAWEKANPPAGSASAERRAADARGQFAVDSKGRVTRL